MDAETGLRCRLLEGHEAAGDTIDDAHLAGCTPTERARLLEERPARLLKLRAHRTERGSFVRCLQPGQQSVREVELEKAALGQRSEVRESQSVRGRNEEPRWEERAIEASGPLGETAFRRARNARQAAARVKRESNPKEAVPCPKT